MSEPSLAPHLHWNPTSGRFLLWAEQEPRDEFEVPEIGLDLPRHPYTATLRTLRRMLKRCGIDVRSDKAALMVVLPSDPEEGPCRSPRMWEGPRHEPVSLLPWRVPALSLPVSVAPALLAQWDAEEPVIPWGPEAATFAALTRLAQARFYDGQCVPGVVQEHGGWAARWRPTGGWAELPRLAGRLPRASRAFADAANFPALRWWLAQQLEERPDDLSLDLLPWGELPLHTAQALVSSFYTTLTDDLARSSLPRPSSSDARKPLGRWLAALHGDDPLLPDEHEGTWGHLQQRLLRWRGGNEDDGFRLGLRLHPPDEDDPGPERWVLEFLVQSQRDPSLQFTAQELWRNSHELLSPATRRELQELVQTGLERASRIAPLLTPALTDARPTEMVLDTDLAGNFLLRYAGALASSGVAVGVPSWWRRDTQRVGLVARVDESRGERGMSREKLLNVQWAVAIGDEELTREELTRLAAHKQRLIRLRGRWIELREEEVAAAARFVEENEEQQLSAIELLKLQGAETGGLPVNGFQGEGALTRLLRGEGKPRASRTPANFVGQLRPYQQRGVGWLRFLCDRGLGACLADDMGLGKTVQLLALLQGERNRRLKLGPTLLIGPTSVLGNWQREAARFTPQLKVVMHHGSRRLRDEGFASQARSANLVLTSYPLAARDVEVLNTVEWGRVVLDEAQNIKNPDAAQSKAIFSLRAEHRVAMTGTPVENRLRELWSIFHFLNPDLLGRVSTFQRHFATPIEQHGNHKKADQLRRLVQPFLLRRLKTDRSIIRDLPDKIEIKEVCQLTREQATLYAAVTDELMEGLEGLDEERGLRRRGQILAALTKLKQICNHPALLLKDGSALSGRSLKLQRLEELLEEIVAEGDKALVFTQFAQFVKLLAPYLERRLKREVLLIHGGTPRDERDRVVERFQEEHGDKAPPVLILSLKAAGVGLNLTAASHVIHFDRWWNPAVEDQATDRAYRIGQDRKVQVRKLMVAGTLEEHIDALIERKRKLAAQVVGAGESWLTELSNDDLKELLALRPEAEAE